MLELLLLLIPMFLGGGSDDEKPPDGVEIGPGCSTVRVVDMMAYRQWLLPRLAALQASLQPESMLLKMRTRDVVAKIYRAIMPGKGCTWATDGSFDSQLDVGTFSTRWSTFLAAIGEMTVEEALASDAFEPFGGQLEEGMQGAPAPGTALQRLIRIVAAGAPQGGPQGGGAPEQPVPNPPPVCAMLVQIEADGREVTMCKQIELGVWRIFKDADELLPQPYADPGKAAQKVIQLLDAANAKGLTITTPSAQARIIRWKPNEYHWRVKGNGVPKMGSEPTLLDAMGAAYEAAGGL